MNIDKVEEWEKWLLANGKLRVKVSDSGNVQGTPVYTGFWLCHWFSAEFSGSSYEEVIGKLWKEGKDWDGCS